MEFKIQCETIKISHIRLGFKKNDTTDSRPERAYPGEHLDLVRGVVMPPGHVEQVDEVAHGRGDRVEEET